MCVGVQKEMRTEEAGVVREGRSPAWRPTHTVPPPPWRCHDANRRRSILALVDIVVVVVDIVVVVVVPVVIVVFVVVSWVGQWRRRCRRRSTVGVEVSAGRSLESAPGCLFLPFRLSLHTRFVCTREPARRFVVVRSTATTWLCRLSPTPSAASAPSPSSLSSSLFFPASLSIYSTTMCLDNETPLFQKISRSKPTLFPALALCLSM